MGQTGAETHENKNECDRPFHDRSSGAVSPRRVARLAIRHRNYTRHDELALRPVLHGWRMVPYTNIHNKCARSTPERSSPPIFGSLGARLRPHGWARLKVFRSGGDFRPSETRSRYTLLPRSSAAALRLPLTE